MSQLSSIQEPVKRRMFMVSDGDGYEAARVLIGECVDRTFPDGNHGCDIIAFMQSETFGFPTIADLANTLRNKDVVVIIDPPSEHGNGLNKESVIERLEYEISRTTPGRFTFTTDDGSRQASWDGAVDLGILSHASPVCDSAQVFTTDCVVFA